MTETFTPKLIIEAAFVTDRGLSEKRPVNEDSYLSDSERSLFVVADGVGGAQAGEVASETAVEVLNEAFRYKLDDNDDIEDLMELAIQRANNSIYQMAREHPDFATMATTVVALHLRGSQATIGHVGDSRLYRLAPDGRLYRETQDHSVVEEEVRAGRMTPEQAANHPSRNVISRALGAESTVEVDMRTIPFEVGTVFLLCSDGITRHLNDTEICDLLRGPESSQALCNEMKRVCYERGAEDNLTAVIVRANSAATLTAGAGSDEEESTITQARAATASSLPVASPVLAPAAPVEPPTPFAGNLSSQRESGGPLKKLLLALLLIGAVVGAFFGGMALRDKFAELTGWSIPGVSSVAPVGSSPVTLNGPAEQTRAAFLSERKALDEGAEEWLKKQDAAGVANPDAKHLYFRGRAYLLTEKPAQAIVEFDKALTNLRSAANENPMLRMEIEAAKLRANLDGKSEKPFTNDQTRQALNDLLGLPATPPVAPAGDGYKSDK